MLGADRSTVSQSHVKDGDTRRWVAHPTVVDKLHVLPPFVLVWVEMGVGALLFGGPKFRERGFWNVPPVGVHFQRSNCHTYPSVSPCLRLLSGAWRLLVHSEDQRCLLGYTLSHSSRASK